MSIYRTAGLHYTTLAEGKRFIIDTFTLTPDDVSRGKMQALVSLSLHDHYDMKPGTYTRLFDKRLGQCVMSNTAMELRTNREVIEQARGHVLIAGLGISMILPPILGKPEVKTVTVIEKHAEVLDLNIKAGLLPVAGQGAARLKVVISDIEKFAPAPGMKYDAIYFDIWNKVGHHNLPQMDRLHAKFASCLSEGGWLWSWRREDSGKEIGDHVKAFYRELIRREPVVALILRSMNVA